MPTDNYGLPTPDKNDSFKVPRDVGLLARAVDAALKNQETQTTEKIKRVEYFLNVKDYGATGDGQTDDSTAIRETILVAKEQKRKGIYFPSGTYIVSSPIAVGNNSVDEWNLRFVGDGADVDGRGTSLVVDFDGYMVETDLTQVSGGWRGVHFENMTIRSSTPKFSKAIKLIHSQLSSIKNVNFIGLDRGLVITGNSHYPIIERCKFYNNRHGILIPQEGDVDFVPGNANNGELTGCWFESNDYPFTLRDGTEWKIRDLDFEGMNGPVEISSQNVVDNVRFERNQYESKWLIVKGDANRINVNVHGIGGVGVPDWRIFVEGKRNNFKINSRYTALLCTETAGDNHYEINLVNQEGYTDIDANLIITSKRSTLIVDGVYQSRKPTRQSGQNLAVNAALQGISNASGSKTDEHGISFTSYAISENRSLVSYGTGSVAINTQASDIAYFSADLHVESELAFVELVAIQFVKLYLLNEWVTVYGQRRLSEGQTNLDFLMYKDRLNNENGKVTFGLGRIAINKQPINTFKAVNQVNVSDSVIEQLHETEFRLGQFIPATSLQLDILPSAFDGLIFKNETENPMRRVDSFYRALDDYGLRYMFSQSLIGAIPPTALYAEVLGYSMMTGSKYVKTILSRTATSDNFTVVTSLMNIGLGGSVITGANNVGTLAGSNLTDMKFVVKYY